MPNWRRLAVPCKVSRERIESVLKRASPRRVLRIFSGRAHLYIQPLLRLPSVSFLETDTDLKTSKVNHQESDRSFSPIPLTRATHFEVRRFLSHQVLKRSFELLGPRPSGSFRASRHGSTSERLAPNGPCSKSACLWLCCGLWTRVSAPSW